jgi:carboxymethylenebutenolidase
VLQRVANLTGLPHNTRGAVVAAFSGQPQVIPMGQTIKLKAADGRVIGAYRAQPTTPPRGAVVILQEIFGLNSHIRAVADLYAKHGYLAVAPALFDRAQPDVELPYSAMKEGVELMMALDPAQTLLDVRAAIDNAGAAGKVATVGYCWGGTLSYGAACHLPLSAAVCYYGGRIASMLEHTPRCPTLFHFGERDTHIPLGDVERIRQAYPVGVYYTYGGAEHGFNCDQRASYDAPSAQLAFDRTLEFLSRHIG